MTARENLIAALLRTELCLAFRDYEIETAKGDLRSLAPVSLNFRRIAARIEEGLASAENALAAPASVCLDVRNNIGDTVTVTDAKVIVT